jgi:myosin heavy subunit
VLDQLRCAGVVEAVRVMTEVSQRGLGWEVGLR